MDMMWFSPRVEGTSSLHAEPRAFVSTFARRIESGLFPRASSRRNRYVVTHQGSDRLAFRATHWLTAVNVGLNDVELTVSSDGRANYTIQYRRWANYALVWSAFIGLLLIASFVLFDIRSYIASHAMSRIPGLSIDQNVVIAWAMAMFWGFVWPWLLIALHKKPLRRLMEQLIAEVDAASMGRT
jgi:hypothetical protein